MKAAVSAYWLVIDDERELDALHAPLNTMIVYARTSVQGIELLKQQDWDLVFLDHDLGGPDTIMPVVDYLSEEAFVNERWPAKMIYIHTANSSVAETMRQTLARYGYEVSRIIAIEHGLFKFETKGV